MRYLLSLWFSLLLGAAPREIPEELLEAFTLNGQIGVTSYYFDASYPLEHPLVYDGETVEKFKLAAQMRQISYYGPTDQFLYEAFDRFRIAVSRGKTVGVIGSTIPWYEAVVLAYGGKPIAIDYNKIISRHPGIQTRTVAEYDENPELFDTLVSISSIEHDGLGRYGDPVDPEGDLKAMKKMKKMLKPGGLLFLAVPVGVDHLYWNAHRIYGSKRLPLLLKGWKQVATFGFDHKQLHSFSEGYHQPVFVLRAQELQ